MKTLKVKRVREHWTSKGTPRVSISMKHASFVNVKFIEDVNTLQGTMRLASTRILGGEDLICAGMDGNMLGISVGHCNHNEVLEIDGKFYMHGTDSRNIPFYKVIDGQRCSALYEVEVENGDVVHAATVELFGRLGLA